MAPFGDFVVAHCIGLIAIAIVILVLVFIPLPLEKLGS